MVSSSGSLYIQVTPLFLCFWYVSVRNNSLDPSLHPFLSPSFLPSEMPTIVHSSLIASLEQCLRIPGEAYWSILVPVCKIQVICYHPCKIMMLRILAWISNEERPLNKIGKLKKTLRHHCLCVVQAASYETTTAVSTWKKNVVFSGCSGRCHMSINFPMVLYSTCLL